MEKRVEKLENEIKELNGYVKRYARKLLILQSRNDAIFEDYCNVISKKENITSEIVKNRINKKSDEISKKLLENDSENKFI